MFPNDPIKVMLVGGKPGNKIVQQNNAAGLTYHTYREVVANARANYDWLINNLTQVNT